MERKNILICDDEEGIRESLNLILSDDYNTAFATNGREAIEHIKSHQTDLVILDIKMPKLNGLDTLKHIKMIDPNIEVLMVTGYKSVETATEAVKGGASGYIVKPFEKDQILKTVQENLKKKK